MLNWAPDDADIRWLYRAIHPYDELHCLTSFKNMEEEDAEASWNFDHHVADRALVPLVMQQRRIQTNALPMGLSFFLFQNDHDGLVVVEDLPTVAEAGDAFAIIVQDKNNIMKANAFRRLVQQNCKPRKIRNAANMEVTLKAFVCYKANSALLVAGCQFTCYCDHTRANHTIVAPSEGVMIGCVECKVGGRPAADPVGAQPPLFDLLDFRMHCFRIRAAAQPRALQAHFDGNVHRLAQVLYRGFDTDCSEEDSRNIVAILQLLDVNNYTMDAVKQLNTQDVVDLLLVLFDSEYLDEHETKCVVRAISWVRSVFDNEL